MTGSWGMWVAFGFVTWQDVQIAFIAQPFHANRNGVVHGGLLKNFAAHEVKHEVSCLYYAIQAYRKSNPEKAVRFMEQAMQDVKSYLN